ncbi:serine/threonine-protein kinase KIN2 [Puccinia graminis f. sp. tritici]|uniref:non-specific serine/threonine protein kinase n=1 Tax=Puccinia graminis f. sp. tritici TaxID=56615 RepID=A0A5B0RN43_PUCGR|nr:serine/threonine-protein kinase KIN2 [Puccinia graminis f. sp. tritici]
MVNRKQQQQHLQPEPTNYKPKKRKTKNQQKTNNNNNNNNNMEEDHSTDHQIQDRTEEPEPEQQQQQQQQQQQHQHQQEEEDEETETLISSETTTSPSRSNSPSILSQNTDQSTHHHHHNNNNNNNNSNNSPSQNTPSSSKPSSIRSTSNRSITQIEQHQPSNTTTKNHSDHPNPQPSPLRIITPTTSNELIRSLHQPTSPSSSHPALALPPLPPPPPPLPQLIKPHNTNNEPSHSNSPHPDDPNLTQKSLPFNISPPIRSNSSSNTPRQSILPSNAQTPPPSHHHHPPPSQLVSPTSTLASPENNEPTRASPSSHLLPTSGSLQFTQNMPGRSRRQLGEYTLGKTLGAGSMGKVKLAISSITGEKIAIKIIPRHTSLSAAQQQLEKDKNKENHSGPSSTRDHKDNTKSQPITPSPSFIEKAKNKDISKEIRTIREASIVLLLHHPYVCGMKSMLVYPHHYYMLFEYVNGGQMLDYIISHGRLRERAARKFARQMGSALEYCHANSIVHRDLKIENILISKTGNIKIIDFGLSNLFSPNSNLQTFCGSLYFAAPELLNAKVYIGPEVDVWSFGIVLFVLVCGKVPFDDQSMPALHAKIKRGQVDYPTWLSSECKHVLSRMLVTNPSNRATLQEILNHPWMVKGYDGPPDPHIPHREPLRINQIDPEVIKGMTGFEFGSAEKIEADLRSVLSSEMYAKVLKLYDDKRTSSTNGSLEPVYNTAHSSSNTSMSPISGNKRDAKNDRDPNRTPSKSSKRFSGFGFYSKKMAGGLAAVLNTVGGAKNDDKSNSDPNSSISNGFESVLLNGQTLDSLDPTRGFHPLISIYFLVREKIERERIYGPGVFASSTLSVTGPPPPPVPPSAYRSELSSHGPQLASPLSTTNELASAPSARLLNKNRNTMAGSEFDGKQRDQAALLLDMHQKGSTKQRNGLMSIRPSTATERMVSTPLPSAPSSPSHTAEFAPSRAKILNSFNPSKRRSVHIMTAPESSGVLQAMTDVMPSQRAPDSNANGPNTRADRVVSMVEPANVLAGPSDSERSPTGFARRFGSLLGRSASVNDPDYKRHRPRSSIGLGHKSSSKTPLSALPQVTESTGLSPPFSPGGLQEQQQTAAQAQPDHVSDDIPTDAIPMSAPISGQSGPMAAFGAKSDLDANLSSRSRHHQRGSSAGGEAGHNDVPASEGEGKVALKSSASGPNWRPRMSSLQGKAKRPTSPSTNPATTNVLSESEGEPNPLDEDADVQPLEIGSPDSTLPKHTAPLVAFSGRTAPPSSKSSDKIKPIYLKGLFSVATTSTRGPQVLRADLVTVLNRIGFQHREIKGGFECAHAPSIDLSSYHGGTSNLNANTGGVENLVPISSPPSHYNRNGKKTAESLKKKVSKASFGKHHALIDNQRLKVNGSTATTPNPTPDGLSEPSLNGGSQTGDLPRQATPSLAGTETIIIGATSNELGELTSPVNGPINQQGTSSNISKNDRPPSSNTTTSKSRNNNLHNNNNHNTGSVKKLDLVVRFEIFIVKMPLLPGISGLQFRRISGNAWQYQTFDI